MFTGFDKCWFISERWLDICIWNDKVQLEDMHSKLCKTSPKLCQINWPASKNFRYWFSKNCLIQSHKDSLPWTLSCSYNEALLSLWVSNEWLIPTWWSRLKALRLMSCLPSKIKLFSQIRRIGALTLYWFKRCYENNVKIRLEEMFW